MTSKQRGLQRHSDEQQQYYEREARLQYGRDAVNTSLERWSSYSQAQQNAIIAEGDQIYSELADALEAGARPGEARVVAILERWRKHLAHFYEPSIDYLRGLGQLYNSHPDFIANFRNLHADLPAFLEAVIEDYVDDLETAELKRMLAEDEEMAQRRAKLSR